MAHRQTTHLSPALHPPSVCQHWALLEEAGKPLIGKLGEKTQQRRGEKPRRERIYENMSEEMWSLNLTWVGQDRGENIGMSSVLKTGNKLLTERLLIIFQ